MPGYEYELVPTANGKPVPQYWDIVRDIGTKFPDDPDMVENVVIGIGNEDSPNYRMGYNDPFWPLYYAKFPTDEMQKYSDEWVVAQVWSPYHEWKTSRGAMTGEEVVTREKTHDQYSYIVVPKEIAEYYELPTLWYDPRPEEGKDWPELPPAPARQRGRRKKRPDRG